MKIRANKQIIESILINLQPFLEKKDASQITSHIHFDTKNGTCVVRGTDSEIGLQIVTDNIIIESIEAKVVIKYCIWYNKLEIENTHIELMWFVPMGEAAEFVFLYLIWLTDTFAT